MIHRNRTQPNGTQYLSVASQIRHAVTVIEVLFAMGIALVGLAGIAALLPLASRQASYSYNLTRSASMADDTMNQIEADDLIALDGLEYWNQAVGVPQWSTAFQGPPAGSTIRPSYCIDPIYWGTQPSIPAAFGAPGAFERTYFPYYAQTYNPLSDAANAPSAWPAPQPRMFRATYKPYVGLGVTNPASRMSYKAAINLFGSRDDLTAIENDQDGTKNIVIGQQTSLLGDILKAASENVATRMITVSPTPVDPASPAGTNPLYNVAVVVFRQRLLDLSTPDLTTLTTESLPEAERVAWALPPSLIPSVNANAAVANTSTFHGDSGFELNLYSHRNTDSRVRTNDWILLSREFNFPIGPIYVFGWFRITSVDGDVIVNSPGNQGLGKFVVNNDPFGNVINANSIWRKRIRVTGDDWIFQSGAGGGAQPTTATLMSDIVTVHQRSMQLD